MAILNYTTEVAPLKTALAVQTLLAQKGAQRVSVDYDKDGQPTAVEFVVSVHNQPVHFRLPCNVEGVRSALWKAKIERRYKTVEHARRVAWRIIKDWVEVQMAFVEAGQADMAEVFLPYAIDSQGETMYQLFKESKQKQLTAGTVVEGNFKAANE